MQWLIAQGVAPERLSSTLLYGAMVLIGLLAVAWIAIVWAKRRSQREMEPGASALPFSLHDLRRLHEEGQLTDEEFERARSRIVSMSKAQLEKPAPKKSEREVSAPPKRLADDSQGDLG